MKEFKYVITDAEGIHARPATMLVKKAAGFKSDINIEAEGKKVKKEFLVLWDSALKREQRLQ